MSRSELMTKLHLDPDTPSIDSFETVLAKYSYSDDVCECCKLTIGSMLASLVNSSIIDEDRDMLQDTNDRSMARTQK